MCHIKKSISLIISSLLVLSTMTSSCKKENVEDENAEKIKALSGKWYDVDNYFQFVDFQSETDVNIRGLRYGYTIESDSITFIDKEQYLIGVPRTTTHYFSVIDNQLIIKDLTLYTAADFYYQNDVVVFKKGAYPNEFLGEWYCQEYGFYIGFLSDKNVVSEALFPEEKILKGIDTVDFYELYGFDVDEEYLIVDTSYIYNPTMSSYSFTDTELTFTTKNVSDSVIDFVTYPYELNADTLIITITEVPKTDSWSFKELEYYRDPLTWEMTRSKDTLVCKLVLSHNRWVPSSGAAYPF